MAEILIPTMRDAHIHRFRCCNGIAKMSSPREVDLLLICISREILFEKEKKEESWSTPDEQSLS